MFFFASIRPCTISGKAYAGSGAFTRRASVRLPIQRTAPKTQPIPKQEPIQNGRPVPQADWGSREQADADDRGLFRKTDGKRTFTRVRDLRTRANCFFAFGKALPRPVISDAGSASSSVWQCCGDYLLQQPKALKQQRALLHLFFRRSSR